jgi:hypothetical protein
MTATTDDVAAAVRLGWTVAEVRGRNWPEGPRPAAARLPTVPGDVLPLRSQRTGSASRRESASALVALARRLELTGATELEDQLGDVLAPLTAAGEASLVEARAEGGSANCAPEVPAMATLRGRRCPRQAGGVWRGS